MIEYKLLEPHGYASPSEDSDSQPKLDDNILRTSLIQYFLAHSGLRNKGKYFVLNLFFVGTN